MRAFIPALAVCAVLQAGAAAQPAPQAAPAAASKPAAGMLQATLATPGDSVVVAQHGGDRGTVRAGLDATSTRQPDSGEEHRPTTAAMLLAALILMTGIALRRWGVGDR